MPPAGIFSARGRNGALTLMPYEALAAQAGTPMAVQGEEAEPFPRGFAGQAPPFPLAKNIPAGGSLIFHIRRGPR